MAPKDGETKIVSPKKQERQQSVDIFMCSDGCMTMEILSPPLDRVLLFVIFKLSPENRDPHEGGVTARNSEVSGTHRIPS